MGNIEVLVCIHTRTMLEKFVSVSVDIIHIKLALCTKPNQQPLTVVLSYKFTIVAINSHSSLTDLEDEHQQLGFII